MLTALETDDVTVTELTHEEGVELFDRASREELGVSGETFVDRWERNDFPPEWSAAAVTRLEILIPFAR